MRTSTTNRYILLSLFFLTTFFCWTSTTKAFSFDNRPHRHSLTKRRAAATVADTPNNNEQHKDSTTSVASASFSLIKAMVGSGCLALPAGAAVVSNFASVLWPANILLAVLGALSAYTFSLYGRLTHQTQATSLGDLWQRVMQKNESSSSRRVGVVSISNFSYCFGCLLMYMLVIGDALSSLLQATTAQGAAAWWTTRQAAILAVSSTVLWPLCNLSSLAALAPISLLGVVGSLLVISFMGWRCPALVAASPYAVPGQGFLTSGAVPSFGTYQRSLLSPAPLILVAMGCVALMAHFSACDFYHSFRSKRDVDGSVALRKFHRTTVASYAAVALFNALTLSFGFLTFGGNSAGIILNNYAAADWGAFVSRILVVVSVVGGFPFLFNAARSEGQAFFPNMSYKTLTAMLLSALTSLGLVLPDAGFVVSLTGAVMGSAIVYIFPALLFLKQTKGKENHKLERWFCRGLLAFGYVAAAIGGLTSVINSYFPHLLR